MDSVIVYILMLPVVLWSIFQAPLYNNAVMVEESLKLAIYEGQKEASLNGRYDDEIYKEMRDYLVNNHNYNPNVIEIKGTETLVPRGGELTVEVTVPKPVTNVLDIFDFDDDQPFVVKKNILSEYIE